MAPQSKRMVDDMSPEKLSEVIKDMTNGNITLDVRRLQAALFMSQINAQITDTHKQMLGPDLSSATPHYLWLSLWGLILGAGITLLIIFKAIKTLLNVLSIAFYIFIVLEYALMFAAIKIGNYAKKPEIQENENTKAPLGKVCLAITVGWGIKGLTEAQKI